MKNFELFKKVELPYFIGALVFFNFIIISIVTYNNYSFPLIFPIVCFCTYCAVLIRGRLDKKSWGIRSQQLKFSALIGYLIFLIILVIEIYFLLERNFNLPIQQVKKLTIYFIIGLFLLFLILYLFWFRKVNFNNLNE